MLTLLQYWAEYLPVIWWSLDSWCRIRLPIHMRCRQSPLRHWVTVSNYVVIISLLPVNK